MTLSPPLSAPPSSPLPPSLSPSLENPPEIAPLNPPPNPPLNPAQHPARIPALIPAQIPARIPARGGVAWSPLLALCAMCSAVALSETSLFPFAAFLVASFRVTDDPAELGYYAGFLASAFYAGSLATSTFWGGISDKFGRKPVLIMGLLANALFSTLFGFSPNLSFAITTRFANGLLNGIIPVGRTFALMGASWGVGFLIGPALGGFLCEPAKKYPFFFPKGSFFEKFAYAPPCILIGIISIFGLLTVIFFLPETRGRAKMAPPRETKIKNAEMVGEEKDNIEGEKDKIVGEKDKSGGGKDEEFEKEREENKVLVLESRDSLLEPLLGEKILEEEKTKKVVVFGGEKGGKTKRDEEKIIVSDEILEDNGILAAFFVKETFISALIYSLLGITTASQNEVFPLWAMTSPSLGGLGFESGAIGLAQASSGIALIPFQLFLYAPISRKLGALKTLKVMLGAMALLTFFPVVTEFKSKNTRLLFCVFFMMVRGVSVISSFTSTIICLTNSIRHPHYLGSLQGLTQTLNMALEAAGPTLGASVFAWSLSSVKRLNGPLGYRLYWELWGLLCVGMLGLACLLGESVDRRKFVVEGEGEEGEGEEGEGEGKGEGRRESGGGTLSRE